MKILVESQSTSAKAKGCTGNCPKATGCGANCPVLQCGVKFS